MKTNSNSEMVKGAAKAPTSTLLPKKKITTMSNPKKQHPPVVTPTSPAEPGEHLGQRYADTLVFVRDFDDTVIERKKNNIGAGGCSSDATWLKRLRATVRAMKKMLDGAAECRSMKTLFRVGGTPPIFLLVRLDK